MIKTEKDLERMMKTIDKRGNGLVIQLNAQMLKAAEDLDVEVALLVMYVQGAFEYIMTHTYSTAPAELRPKLEMLRDRGVERTADSMSRSLARMAAMTDDERVTALENYRERMRASNFNPPGDES